MFIAPSAEINFHI